jgi:MFS family permease
VPASLSLIAGHFTRDERPRAVSVYMQGVSVSLLLGYFAAGWLSELFGWRIMFTIIGLPGLALALLTHRTIKEPARVAPASTDPSFREVCLYLWKNRTFRHVLYSFVVNWFFSYGTLQWTPTFFVRSFGLDTGKLGTWLALIYGVGFLLGTYLGGEWATRFAKRDEKKQLEAMAVVTSISGVTMALVFNPQAAPTSYFAFGWLGFSMLSGALIAGPQFSVIQTLVPARMRAVSISIVYLFGNLIGIGLGPWAAGALSDALRPWAGDESLRYAMLILCPVCVWSAWHLWAASKTIAADLESARTDDRGAEDGTCTLRSV